MRATWVVGAAVAAASWAPHAARAQQVLYTPVPPKGSAYVRFVNALGAPARVTPDFMPAATLGSGTADRVAPFTVVENVAGRALSLDVTAGGRTGHGTFMVPPGGFTTVMLRPDGTSGVAMAPTADESDFNQTRAHLAFYNATGGCAAAGLKLSPSGAAVFANVAPGAEAARAVNPVTATVVPACGGADAPNVALQGLAAGALYSIWLMQPAPGQTLSFISRDSTLAWKP